MKLLRCKAEFNPAENTRNYCLNLLNELCSYKVCKPGTPVDIDMNF